MTNSGSIFGLVIAMIGSLGVAGAGGVPVVPAPVVRECREAKAMDLGRWDDVLRFEDRDFILLRKGDALFSCSPVDGVLKKVYQAPSLTNAFFAGGLSWGKRQWAFFRSFGCSPFAVDVSNGKIISFDVPGVKGEGEHFPTIGEIINAGFGPGTFVAISPNGATGWPRVGRDDNAPLYFWMNLESGVVKQLPAGWDLDFFSADQRKVIFEKPSTNSWMYRPWVTVSVTNGEATGEPADQTHGLWSRQMLGYWDLGNEPWLPPNPCANIWELRTGRTPTKLLIPQPGRGDSDDTFAGLAVRGEVYPFSVAANGMDRSPGARVAGSLAAVALQPDGGSGNFLWLKELGKNESPILLATNCKFELVGERGCVWTEFRPNALLPDAFFYDVEAKSEWNVFADLPIWSRMESALGNTNAYAGFNAGPMSSLRLIAGFGSARYSGEVLCAFTQTGIVADNFRPLPVQRINMLLTADGRRYKINLPASVREFPMSQAWLHKSGKLIIGKDEFTPGGQVHWHIFLVDLQVERESTK
jgi:hypothetical protein